MHEQGYNTPNNIFKGQTNPMKTLLQTLLIGSLLLLTNSASAQGTEHEAVKRVMQDFLDAYKTGDGNYIRKSFHKEGVMLGHAAKANKMQVVSGEEFAQRFDGAPAEDEAKRTRTVEILDITANAALTKVSLNYPNWDGIDYITLSKIDGKWIIISKSWSGTRK